MRFLVLAVALLIATAADAQLVRSSKGQQETTLWTSYRSAAMTTGGGLGGHVLPSTTGFQITALTWYISTAAATATGTMNLRVTDGSTSCDVAVDCTSNNVRATGAKRVAASGCNFAAGSALSASVQAQCDTAQPTVTSLSVVGKWL